MQSYKMKIENAQYIKDFGSNTNSSISCTINGVEWSVPLNPSNKHYAEILAQVKAGTLTIKDAD